jgi:hypothetical protein
MMPSTDRLGKVGSTMARIRLRDGWLNDIQSFPPTQADAFAALDSAVGGQPIARGITRRAVLNWRPQ